MHTMKHFSAKGPAISQKARLHVSCVQVDGAAVARPTRARTDGHVGPLARGRVADSPSHKAQSQAEIHSDARRIVNSVQQLPRPEELSVRQTHSQGLVRSGRVQEAPWHVTAATKLEMTWRERLETSAEETWEVPSSSTTTLHGSPRLANRLVAVTHGSAAQRGTYKPDMQDQHVTVSDLQAVQGHDEDEGGVSCVTSRVPCSLAAVFDGHCGSRSARYSAKRITSLIATNMQLWESLDGAAEPGGLAASAVLQAAGALRASFAELEREILDEDRHKPPGEFDGTTALAGLQVGEHLFVANLGDSRAVLSRAGIAVRLSRDHTPDVPDERQRVEAVGGYVRQHRGVWRLVLPLGPGCGLKVCAVSRALGDIDYKEPTPLISAVPDIVHWRLLHGADQFVIYASDGIWAVCTDQEAVECVEEALREAESAACNRQQSAAVAAMSLKVFAQQRGSGDDITAVVALLNWAEE